MELKKLSSSFITKIAVATNGNLVLLLKIFATLNSLQLTRQLWSTAAGEDSQDIYTETDLPSIFNKLSTLTRTIQGKLSSQGLTQSDVAGFLTDVNKTLESFDTIKLTTHLDPSASDKLRDAKDAVANAVSNYVPVTIPSTSKPKAPAEVANDAAYSGLTSDSDITPGEFSTSVGPMIGPNGEDFSGY